MKKNHQLLEEKNHKLFEGKIIKHQMFEEKIISFYKKIHRLLIEKKKL